MREPDVATPCTESFQFPFCRGTRDEIKTRTGNILYVVGDSFPVYTLKTKGCIFGKLPDTAQ